MWRALVWLNLYGCEAVRHKLKNGLKTQKRHFLAVLDLMSDSLTTIYVKQHQCPSHQLILLTQGPIPEIFMKKYWELAELENYLFLSRPFWIFFSSLWKLVIIYRLARICQNFDEYSGFQPKKPFGSIHIWRQMFFGNFWPIYLPSSDTLLHELI